MTRVNLALLILIACVASLPLFGGAYALRIGTVACMYAILALSWNIVGGFAGYPSFATAAFFGFGAYATAILLLSLIHISTPTNKNLARQLGFKILQ